MPNSLVIRADAGPVMGAGHVMRCLALAQAWQDTGGSVSFLIATELSGLIERLHEERIEVVPMVEEPGTPADAAATADFARRVDAAWVAVDGYRFGAAYQDWIKERDLRLLFLDDYGHATGYSADIVLNQNPGAQAGLYADRGTATQLLLGYRYLLLRREFQRGQRNNRKHSAVVGKILVTMGGGDNRQATELVVRALARLSIQNLRIRVIAGGSDAPTLCQDNASNIEVLDRVTNITEAMAWADLAITGGGGTCWEAAFMGLPCMAIVLADNQRVVVDALSSAGALHPLGPFESLSEETITQAVFDLGSDAPGRRTMSLCGSRLLDGQGAARVVARMQSRPLRLRPAGEDDCRLVFEWANEPATRAASFCSDPILWETHVDWYQGKLKQPGCHYFIVIDDRQTTVGQVRFEIEGPEADISVGLHPGFRGLGYGARALELASAALFRSIPVARINALIKPENQAAIAAFERAGYARVAETSVRGQRALRLVMHGGDGRPGASARGQACSARGGTS